MTFAFGVLVVVVLLGLLLSKLADMLWNRYCRPGSDDEGGGPPLASGGAAAVLLLALLLPVYSFAASDEGGKIQRPAFDWHTYSLTGSLVKPGAERLAMFGARADAVFRAPLGVEVLGRADAAALGDGGAVEHELSDVESFQSLELLVGAARPVRAGIGPAAVYGWTVPLEGGRPALVERYPRTLLVGAMARGSLGWAIAGVGYHEASGNGTRLLFAGQVHVEGRTWVGADGAVGESSFCRGYVLVRLR